MLDCDSQAAQPPSKIHSVAMTIKGHHRHHYRTFHTRLHLTSDLIWSIILLKRLREDCYYFQQAEHSLDQFS